MSNESREQRKPLLLPENQQISPPSTKQLAERPPRFLALSRCHPAPTEPRSTLTVDHNVDRGDDSEHDGRVCSDVLSVHGGDSLDFENPLCQFFTCSDPSQGTMSLP